MSINNKTEKDSIWNPATCSYKNDKYLASIIDDSEITCVETIEADAESKMNKKETNFNEKNMAFKTQMCICFLPFYQLSFYYW